MGYYDYYKKYCVCHGCEVFLSPVDEFGREPSSWPLTVFNVEGEKIGNANSKQEYISIWNADAENKLFGIVYNFFGPFTFLLKMFKCEDANDGIYEAPYEIVYE